MGDTHDSSQKGLETRSFIGNRVTKLFITILFWKLFRDPVPVTQLISHEFVDTFFVGEIDRGEYAIKNASLNSGETGVWLEAAGRNV